LLLFLNPKTLFLRAFSTPDFSRGGGEGYWPLFTYVTLLIEQKLVGVVGLILTFNQ